MFNAKCNDEGAVGIDWLLDSDRLLVRYSLRVFLVSCLLVFVWLLVIGLFSVLFVVLFCLFRCAVASL